MIKPGDIVLCYRKQYKGPFKYLVMRAILFFTTAWWRREPTSCVYHAELAVSTFGDSEFVVATMEPPKYRYKTRKYKRKLIFRPIFREEKYIAEVLEAYLEKHLGKRYDFLRLFMMLLNWIFRTSFFSDHYKNGERDICSEAVARFYEKLAYPCSDLDANSTTPDCIHDFCFAHPELFRVIYDYRK